MPVFSAYAISAGKAVKAKHKASKRVINRFVFILPRYWVKELQRMYKENNEKLYLSISCTTRSIREGEVENVSYYFISIDEEKILCGVESMLRILNEDLMSGFTIDNLDNFENLNKTIFNKTEKFYEQNSYFKILSLLLVSLLDLGLVEI